MSAAARRIAGLLGSGIMAAGLLACGADPPSACLAPPRPPVTLAERDGTDPVIAGDGRGAVVAAWGSITGDPVQVRTRDRAGTWTAPTELGESGTRHPSVAMTSDGRGWIAYEGYDADDHAAVFAASAPDWRPQLISRGEPNARDPQIAVGHDGTVVAAWVSYIDGSRGAIMVATATGGTWSAPTQVAPPQPGAENVALSVAADGTVGLAWVSTEAGHGVHASVRTPDGRWSPPQVLSSTGRDAIEPAVAAAPDGSAWVAWNESRGDGSDARVAIGRFQHGAWRQSEPLDSAAQGPVQMPRPGQARLGPALALAPDGALVAAWAVGSDTESAGQARASIRRPRVGWTGIEHLSAPGNQAGAVAVAIGSGGAPIVAWEEIDHGLLRARARTVTPGTRCVDLTGARTETSSIALTGGVSPVAVFIDLRRSSVQAQELP